MDLIAPHRWTDESGKVLILRKCYADGTSPERYHFRWPTSGYVEATPKSPGLFGWPWGIGLGNDMPIDVLMDLWIVFAADPSETCQHGARVCFAPRGEVVYAGDFDGAWDLLRAGRQQLAAALKEAGGWAAYQSSERPIQHDRFYRDHNWDNLREAIRRQFRRRLDSKHGTYHWHMVERWGSRLASLNRLGREAPIVVVLFALLHDSQRMSDGDDPEHGQRAAAYAREQRGKLFHLGDVLFEKLEIALAEHSMGKVTDDPIIGTCWDADRLQRVTVGVKPDERYMSTPKGKRLCAEKFSAHNLAV